MFVILSWQIWIHATFKETPPPPAPCSLSGITAIPQCHNSSILVVWELMEGSAGNTVYTATAEASDHTYLSCNNTGTSCFLHGAQCDLYYTIIVAASSDQCSSMRSPPYRISMGTCCMFSVPTFDLSHPVFSCALSIQSKHVEFETFLIKEAACV